MDDLLHLSDNKWIRQLFETVKLECAFSIKPKLWAFKKVYN